MAVRLPGNPKDLEFMRVAFDNSTRRGEWVGLHCRRQVQGELEHGAFHCPPISYGVMRLTASQLAAVVDGTDCALHA
jgi:hypothetical protein